MRIGGNEDRGNRDGNRGNSKGDRSNRDEDSGYADTEAKRGSNRVSHASRVEGMMLGLQQSKTR